MSTRWYPLYQKGNPQLRIFLPNFWMKLVKPNALQHKASVPKNKIQFIVSNEMTKHDVKNYLEKIYKVPVADVKTINKMGKTYENRYARHLLKEEDYKVAFVTLPPGSEFEWPDLKISENQDKDYDGSQEEQDTAETMFKKNTGSDQIKYRPGVPTFFGL